MEKILWESEIYKMTIKNGGGGEAHFGACTELTPLKILQHMLQLTFRR